MDLTQVDGRVHTTVKTTTTVANNIDRITVIMPAIHNPLTERHGRNSLNAYIT